MRFEFLNHRLDAPGLRDDVRQLERTNRSPCPLCRCGRDPQRLRACRFRSAGEFLRDEADPRHGEPRRRQQFGPVGHGRKAVREILHAGREQADGIERPRKAFHADRRQQPVGRLDRGEIWERFRRSADRYNRFEHASAAGHAHALRG